MINSQKFDFADLNLGSTSSKATATYHRPRNSATNNTTYFSLRRNRELLVVPVVL